jgi:hypothetical protein
MARTIGIAETGYLSWFPGGTVWLDDNNDQDYPSAVFQQNPILYEGLHPRCGKPAHSLHTKNPAPD